MIWTDVKAYFEPDEALLVNVRSSMGKHGIMLSNTQGWIESDYVDNQDNEGNIGIALHNLSDVPYVIKTGDRIAQGMFIKYLITDDDKAVGKRKGGWGSTNENE